MPSEISIARGGQPEMMYVGEMPWHRLGTRLTEPPTAAKAICAARLDWKVIKKQLYVGDDKWVCLPGEFAVVREDRWEQNEESILGRVKRAYTPLQNRDAFAFFDPLIKTGKVGGESFEMIPIPLDYEGHVEIRLEENGEMRITGTRVHLELVGDATHTDKFPGSR